jgi:UDP-N-acetylglucosamine:LPS N-acetylglucosamine transferase
MLAKSWCDWSSDVCSSDLAAWMLLDQYCDGRRITASVRAAREKPDQLAEMGRRARTLARPDAADRIVDILERVALVA